MPTSNHRAVWLGGGGVSKTRALKRVVEPLATTFFGSDGYLATAQSNHAAHNLGARGRTIPSANGFKARDSLQTAKLRLNAVSQKKMEHWCKLRNPLATWVTCLATKFAISVRVMREARECSR